MSAASNDNEQASDLDEPMGSQSQVGSEPKYSPCLTV